MDKEEIGNLINVARAITGSCLTHQTAVKLIAELYLRSETKDQVELTPDQKIQGIREFIKLGLLEKQDGLSFLKRVMEEQVDIDLREMPKRRRGNIDESAISEGLKGNQNALGTRHQNRFRRGELSDAVIRAIRDGNKTIDAILPVLSQNHGIPILELQGSVGACLTYLTEQERAERLKNPEGKWEYSVAIFDSKEQAGIKTFHSRKEIEKELK